MSIPAEQTLIISTAFLEGCRDQLTDLAERFPSASNVLEGQAAVVEKILARGTTVALDHLAVVELATPHGVAAAGGR